VEESVLRSVDSRGRIVVPAEWRKRWGKKVVMVRLSEGEILVKTLRKRGKLTDWADSIEVPEVKNFANTHELRKAICG